MLQVLPCTRSILGLRAADPASIRSISRFSTADASGLLIAASRGSILLWIIPVLTVFQASVPLVMQVLVVLHPSVLRVLAVPRYF